MNAFLTFCLLQIWPQQSLRRRFARWYFKLWCCDAVDPAELIHATFQTKGIKHLSFKATLMVYTAVGVWPQSNGSSFVITGCGIGIRNLRLDRFSHKTVFVHFCVVPFIGVAVKKDDCTLGKLSAQG